MKILFIYPDLSTDIINFCPSIHILSAILKKEGHQTKLLHINNNHGIGYNEETIKYLSYGYDLFAITATSFNYKYANEIAKWLKESYPRILRILGGSHATIQPEDFESSNFDIFCIGEGEEPMKELCHNLESMKDWTKISNLITRFGINPVRGFQRNLDNLPFWDFDIMETQKIINIRGGWLSISFSRGCNFSCTFCINHLYKKIELGPDDKMSDYLRRRSPGLVIKELISLLEKFNIKYFNIDDDLLMMNKKWMREFTRLYRENIFTPCKIQYIINARADSLDEETVKMLSESGCMEVRMGFETGNEILRNGILQKKISNESLFKAFTMLRKYNVKSIAFAMIGIPGETWDTFNDTVRMFSMLKPDFIRMTFLFPYKHTEIYDYCIENNLFKEDFEIEDNRDYGSPLKFERLTDQELFCMRFLLPWYINFYMGICNNDDILKYNKIPLSELKDRLPEIMVTDKELSEKCKVPHYRYFAGNEYYFELYKP
jgi:anaerobic magnesium-protoporphyrin IX monomethyl ester cyclase